MIRPINTNDNTPINNSVNTPIITNVKENNTSINNTSNNNINRVDILSGDPTRIHIKRLLIILTKRLARSLNIIQLKRKILLKARWNQDFMGWRILKGN